MVIGSIAVKKDGTAKKRKNCLILNLFYFENIFDIFWHIKGFFFAVSLLQSIYMFQNQYIIGWAIIIFVSKVKPLMFLIIMMKRINNKLFHELLHTTS